MAIIPSPLSNSIQGINESTVSGSIFGGNKPDAETKSALQSLSSSVASLQNQVNELSKNNITNFRVFANLQESFATQIDSVRLQLSKVNETLESVATITASESAIDRQKDLYEQEKERRLAEAGARGGKESLLETRIQSALSEPVKRIGNTVSFGFQNLMSFIGTLFGGWLTLEGIKAIKAFQDGDKRKLDDIKNSVIRTLGIVGGVFLIINIGIGRVIASITGLAGKIGKFVFKNTIGRLFDGAMGLAKGAANAVTGAGAKGAEAATKASTAAASAAGKATGKGVLSGIGNIGKSIAKTGFNLALGGVDFFQRKGEGQTNVQAGAGALTSLAGAEAGAKLGSKFPGMLKLPATLIGAGAGYFLGGKGADTLTGVNKSQSPKPQSAKPAPTTSMTPSATNLQINAPDISQSVTEKESYTSESVTEKESYTSESVIEKEPYTSQSVIEKEPYTSQPATQKAPDISQPATQKAPTVQPAVQPQTPIIPPPSPEMIKNFQMAWNYRNNGFARGRIESAWNKLSPEEQQQAKAWAKSTGKDWTEMKLTDKNQISSVRPKETPKSVETSPKPSTAKITPAQTTKMQTVPFNIGPEPEPKPNIVYPPSGPSAPQEKQPYSIGAASNVPNIPSSNPDNFYTLYSQINYNVVM